MDTVYERIAGTSMGRALIRNQSLSSAFVALLNHVISVCSKRGLGIDGVSLTAPRLDNGKIKAEVIFSGNGKARIGGREYRSDFEAYCAANNFKCADALRLNPEFGKFWEKVLTLTESFAKIKGTKLEHINLHKGYVSPDGVIVLEIIVNE